MSLSEFIGHPGKTLRFHVKWKALAGVPTAVTATLTLLTPLGAPVVVNPESAIITSKARTGGGLDWFVEFYATYFVPASNATAAGKWYYRWQSAGDLAAEQEGTFVIRSSPVLAS